MEQQCRAPFALLVHPVAVVEVRGDSCVGSQEAQDVVEGRPSKPVQANSSIGIPMIFDGGMQHRSTQKYDSDTDEFIYSLD